MLKFRIKKRLSVFKNLANSSSFELNGNVTIHALSFFPNFDFEIPAEGILVFKFCYFRNINVIYFGNMFVQRKKTKNNIYTYVTFSMSYLYKYEKFWNKLYKSYRSSRFLHDFVLI